MTFFSWEILTCNITVKLKSGRLFSNGVKKKLKLTSAILKLEKKAYFLVLFWLYKMVKDIKA